MDTSLRKYFHNNEKVLNPEKFQTVDFRRIPSGVGVLSFDIFMYNVGDFTKTVYEMCESLF